MVTTYREKFFKEEITPNEAYRLLTEFIEYCNSDECKNKNLEEMAWNFLSQPVKLTLTEDEKVILRNICLTGTFYIERKHGTLKIHNKLDEIVDFYMYDNLFQFIKERRRI